MFKKVAGIGVAVALMAVSAGIALGGQSAKTTTHERAGKGQLVAKDSAKRRPAAAVARVTLTDFGKVSYSISSTPDHLPIEWAYTVRCTKGSLIDYFPGPGDVHTTVKKATISGTYPKIPLADPDECQFAVAGQIAQNNLGKTVSVKIYDQK